MYLLYFVRCCQYGEQKLLRATVSEYSSPPLFIYRKYTTSSGTTMKNSGNLQDFPIDSLTERIVQYYVFGCFL